MKIIIQAGGLGSRMKALTHVKPKSLISAKYMPIIFHLFKKYPKDEFIIIGDYKFDVLDRYLSTFAKDVNYMLVRATTKGNAAGIKEAVSYIPDNEPFMIIWSDIILSDSFCINEIVKGCQVGLVDFPCSWSLKEGKLVNEQIAGKGVAGLYIFDNKSWFTDFPTEGSFTKWLAEKDIPLSPISLMGSIDVGTLEAYNEISTTSNRCRPYNKIEFIDGKVVKTGLTPEAVKLIEREVVWYKKMEEYGFEYIPKVYNTNPLTMELIHGKNVFLAKMDDDNRKETIRKMVHALQTMHSYEKAPSSAWDLYTEYLKKTIHRLQGIISAIPFANERFITINGKKCQNIMWNIDILRHAVLNTLMSTYYGPIHGDCQLTNTMIDDLGKIYFIDARGYFGKSQVLGDVRYDWAKMYYAIYGNFDQFNIKKFTLDISDKEVTFSISSGGWEHLTDYFLNLIPKEEASVKEIKLIHAIIWLSLASHAWEDYDSMCIAFYNGTLLFNEWLVEYGNEQ